MFLEIISKNLIVVKAVIAQPYAELLQSKPTEMSRLSLE